MRRSPALIAVVLAAAIGLAGCGGSSSGSKAGGKPSANATAPANIPAATAAVKALYDKFFGASVAQAKSMLQDGDTLSAAFKFADRLKGNNIEHANVHSVTFTSPTTASVVFDLVAKTPGAKKYGPPLLRNNKGGAILVNGQWLVTKQTFCTLVGYGSDKPIQGCS